MFTAVPLPAHGILHPEDVRELISWQLGAKSSAPSGSFGRTLPTSLTNCQALPSLFTAAACQPGVRAKTKYRKAGHE